MWEKKACMCPVSDELCNKLIDILITILSNLPKEGGWTLAIIKGRTISQKGLEECTRRCNGEGSGRRWQFSSDQLTQFPANGFLLALETRRYTNSPDNGMEMLQRPLNHSAVSSASHQHPIWLWQTTISEEHSNYIFPRTWSLKIYSNVVSVLMDKNMARQVWKCRFLTHFLLHIFALFLFLLIQSITFMQVNNHQCYFLKTVKNSCLPCHDQVLTIVSQGRTRKYASQHSWFPLPSVQAVDAINNMEPPHKLTWFRVKTTPILNILSSHSLVGPH